MISTIGHSKQPPSSILLNVPSVRRKGVVSKELDVFEATGASASSSNGFVCQEVKVGTSLKERIFGPDATTRSISVNLAKVTGACVVAGCVVGGTWYALSRGCKGNLGSGVAAGVAAGAEAVAKKKETVAERLVAAAKSLAATAAANASAAAAEAAETKPGTPEATTALTLAKDALELAQSLASAAADATKDAVESAAEAEVDPNKSGVASTIFSIIGGGVAFGGTLYGGYRSMAPADCQERVDEAVSKTVNKIEKRVFPELPAFDVPVAGDSMKEAFVSNEKVARAIARAARKGEFLVLIPGQITAEAAEALTKKGYKLDVTEPTADDPVGKVIIDFREKKKDIPKRDTPKDEVQS